MKRKQRVVLRMQPRSEEGQTLDAPDLSESNRPGHALEMAEEERKVHEALAKLSVEHRSVLVMKDMEGMKYEEIAEVMNVPVGTIRSRLHRARLEVRDLLIQADQRAEKKSPS